MKLSALKITLAALAAMAASFANDGALRGPNAPLVSTAEAIIGRPLTPMSYAGVARRTTRRAYGAYGAYGAAGAVGAYGAYGAYGPGCGQVVDAYGRVYSQC
jgi:hypothetical protein